MLDLHISFLIIIPSFIFTVLLLRSIYNPALAKIPGPSWARYTQFWRFFFVWDGKSPDKYYKLHQKYGAVVRTGPNCVDISDPAAIPIIYGIGSKYVKTQFYPIQSAIYKGTVLYNMVSIPCAAIMVAPVFCWSAQLKLANSCCKEFVDFYCSPLGS